MLTIKTTRYTKESIMQKQFPGEIILEAHHHPKNKPPAYYNIIIINSNYYLLNYNYNTLQYETAEITEITLRNALKPTELTKAIDNHLQKQLT